MGLNNIKRKAFYLHTATMELDWMPVWVPSSDDLTLTDDNPKQGVDDDDDAGTIVDAYNLGCIGLINLGLLTLFTATRLGIFVKRSPEWKSRLFLKRFLFHMLLLLSSATDLPMYVSFIMEGRYEPHTYRFHKLEPAFQFAAYSITISDWTSVLYVLKEESAYPFLIKKGSLVTLNVIVSTVCVLNFIALGTGGMDAYVENPVYTVGTVCQFLAGMGKCVYVCVCVSLCIRPLTFSCTLPLTSRTPVTLPLLTIIYTKASPVSCCMLVSS